MMLSYNIFDGFGLDQILFTAHTNYKIFLIVKFLTINNLNDFGQNILAFPPIFPLNFAMLPQYGDKFF